MAAINMGDAVRIILPNDDSGERFKKTYRN